MHDLIITSTWTFDIGWNTSDAQPYDFLATQLDEHALYDAKVINDELRQLNPDIKVFCSLDYREGKMVYDKRGLEYWEMGDLPLDSEFWLRDESGKIAPGWGEDLNGNGTVEESEIELGLIDFTDENFQNLLVKKVEALNASGLFDGIMFDWWNEMGATTGNLDWSKTYLTLETETEARINLLKKIRKAVGDDFYIIVNANKKRVPESAPYINGVYMECGKSEYNLGYSQDELRTIEDTLKWAETAIPEPRFNSLEGWRIVESYSGEKEIRVIERNSEENKKWMRLFTTMSLTLSDGYVLFSDDYAMPSEDHLHNWYNFWSIELGQPTIRSGIKYRQQEGVYIRSFDRGYVVYNGSDQDQTVDFLKPVVNQYDGLKDKSFVVPALDGYIFFK